LFIFVSFLGMVALRVGVGLGVCGLGLFWNLFVGGWITLWDGLVFVLDVCFGFIVLWVWVFVGLRFGLGFWGFGFVGLMCRLGF